MWETIVTGVSETVFQMFFGIGFCLCQRESKSIFYRNKCMYKELKDVKDTTNVFCKPNRQLQLVKYVQS